MPNKPPLQSPIRGIDIVTGHPATTGGPYASPNPVKPHGHPLAVQAQRENKTGPFAEQGSPKDVTVQAGHAKPTSLEEARTKEKETSDKFAAVQNAKRAVQTTVPASTGKVETPGTSAATSAPVVNKPVASPAKPPINIKQPQGMQNPSATSHHVNTSTVATPHAIPPAAKVELGLTDAQGNTSQNAGTETKTS